MGAIKQMRSTMKNNSIETRVALVEQSIGHMNETLLRIERRFDYIDKKFDEVEKKFMRIDERFEKLNDKFDSHFKWIIGTIIFSILLPIVLKLFHIV